MSEALRIRFRFGYGPGMGGGAVKEGIALGCVVEQKVRSSSGLSMLKTWGASLASEEWKAVPRHYSTLLLFQILHS